MQVLALVPRADVACRALFARWLVAFCRASKWYIREDEPLEEELRGWLEPSELQQLVRVVVASVVVDSVLWPVWLSVHRVFALKHATSRVCWSLELQQLVRKP
jgi:hypothetical protein